MKEVFKDVKGFEGLYQVSNLGRIRSLKRTVNKGKCHRTWDEHFLRYGVDSKGYFRTALSKDGHSQTVKVHRLVAEAFLPNPQNLPQVNHKDGNKQNNSVENLEWCDAPYNMQHAVSNGLHNGLKGEQNPSSKLTKEDVQFIRDNYIPRHPEFGTEGLAKKFGVHRKTISRINTGKMWKEGDDS